MNRSLFYSVFTCIVLSIALLCYSLLSLVSAHSALSSLLLYQYFCMLSSVTCIGIGIGLPLIFIASMLGWGQLALLIKGNIPPHLARKGFFNTLTILISFFV